MKLFAQKRLVFQQPPQSPEAQPQPQPQVEAGKDALKAPEIGKEGPPNSPENISNEYKEKGKKSTGGEADKLAIFDNLVK